MFFLDCDLKSQRNCHIDRTKVDVEKYRPNLLPFTLLTIIELKKTIIF